MDPEYLRLYREYAKAIQMYEIARQKRQLDRKRLIDKRNMPPPVRRPVGSPADFQIHQSTPPPIQPLTKKRPEQKIYMGEILGYAKIIPSSPPSSVNNQDVDIDIDKLYDNISLKLYWNAQTHYENCKRAFFNYARRKNLAEHKEKAQQEAAHIANLQLLGVDNNDAQFDALKREVEAACKNALALYRTAPKPKSDAMKVILLENLADAMLVGLDSDGSLTVRSMIDEMHLLMNTNAIKVDKIM